MHPFFQVKNHGECQRIESSVHIWTKKNKPSGRSSAALKSSSAKLVSSPGMHCWPLISYIKFFFSAVSVTLAWIDQVDDPRYIFRLTDLCSFVGKMYALIRYVNMVIQRNDPISYPLISEKMLMLELLFVDRTSPFPSWNIRYTKWRTANTLNSSNVWFRSLNLLSSNFAQRRIPSKNTPRRILEIGDVTQQHCVYDPLLERWFTNPSTIFSENIFLVVFPSKNQTFWWLPSPGSPFQYKELNMTRATKHWENTWKYIKHKVTCPCHLPCSEITQTNWRVWYM